MNSEILSFYSVLGTVLGNKAKAVNKLLRRNRQQINRFGQYVKQV